MARTLAPHPSAAARRRIQLVTVAACGLVLAFVAAALAPADAEARAPRALKLITPTTDNYKASYNADPNAPELRTWLATRQLRLGRHRISPAPQHVAAGSATFPRVMRVRSHRGGGAILTVTLHSGPAQFLQFRVGPQNGWFGVFLQTTGVTDLQAEPVRVWLRLHRKGRVIAQRKLTYRYAPNVLNHSLEAGGPSGRWRVGSRATPTNIERGHP